VLTIPLRSARRFAIVRQHLSRAPKPDMLRVIRDLGCLQLDPTSAVAQSHLLVLWSRLGSYDRGELDRLLWTDRQLFEYWAHAASIVLVEDLPIHRLRMRTFARDDSAHAAHIRAFMRENGAIRRSILRRLRSDGPLPARALDRSVAKTWVSSGWTSGQGVVRMLEFMWGSGRVLVAGRNGRTRLWDLSERVLPQWAPEERPPEREVVRRAAGRSLRALGVATEPDIRNHFTRGRYPNLRSVLVELERKGVIERVRIEGMRDDHFVHADDVSGLRNIDDSWTGRTTLLSPFDNLICDRDRTDRLFGFRFRIEIYTPKHLRRHGYFVMPILRGDRFVGRIDPMLDRRAGRLVINALHTEGGVSERSVRAAAASTAEQLGDFLGVNEVVFA
jgi:uncharacterized protein